MDTLLIVLSLVVAVLLVLVVLAQNSKGGGLVGEVSSASQAVGSRRATEWIEKATWILVAVLFVLTLGANTLTDKNANNTGITSPNIEKAKSVAPVTAPELELPAANGGEADPSESSTDEGVENGELTQPAVEEDATHEEPASDEQ
ncbi:preprotein translocase subunit SecG [Rapidithrix thailandica]|uniref:Protein-export membrane protein SecG n=1 Tax=Rapidithrix thailandica TaxID=413964 RepID=A0AAW9RWK4_9BACT